MDLYNLTNNDYRTQFFYRSGVWQKPKGISMVYIHAIGAGGGGAGGASGASGTNRNGGGGGACGNTSRLLIPAAVISDNLTITVGLGGTGGSSGTNGIVGADTIITSARGTATNVARILYASGGNAGNGVSGGLGSSANSIFNTIPSALGVTGFVGNQAGGNGGTSTGAVGVTITYSPSGNILLSSGAGGASVGTNDTAFSGGSITSTAVTPQVNGGAAGGGDGEGGFLISQPFSTSGGGGGGSNGTGVGGKGGDGAIGSGGGGGGAGTTGGAGGKGGDGLVLIVCW
jgi:hypothetical protein